MNALNDDQFLRLVGFILLGLSLMYLAMRWALGRRRG